MAKNNTEKKVAEKATIEIIAAEANARKVETSENANATNSVEEVVPVVEPVPVEEKAPVEEVAITETEAPAEETETAETETPAEETETVETEAPAEETETVETEAPAEETETAETEAPAEETETAETEAPAEETETAETEAPAEETETAETEAPAEKTEITETAVPTMEPRNEMGEAPTQNSAKSESKSWRNVLVGCAVGVTAALMFLLACLGVAALREKDSAIDNRPVVETTVTVESTKAPDESTKAPDESTKAPDESTKAPDESTKAPDESTKAPDESTKAPDESTKAPDETTTVQVNVDMSGLEKAIINIAKEMNSDVDITSEAYLVVDKLGEETLQEWGNSYGKVETAEAIAALLVFAPEVRGEWYALKNKLTYNPNAETEYWDSYYAMVDEYKTQFGKNPDAVLMNLPGYETNGGNQQAMLAAAKKELKATEYAAFEKWYLAKSEGYDAYKSVEAQTAEVDEYIKKASKDLLTSSGVAEVLKLQLELQNSEKDPLVLVDANTGVVTSEYATFINEHWTLIVAGAK